jgi:putative addiction module killer protein
MGMYRLKFWQSASGEQPVRTWLLALEKVEKRRIDILFKLLEEFGPALKLPNSRPLGGGLYELRDDSKGPGFRVYYERVEGILLVLLVGGDKSTQTRDIEAARARMKKNDKGETK